MVDSAPSEHSSQVVCRLYNTLLVGLGPRTTREMDSLQHVRACCNTHFNNQGNGSGRRIVAHVTPAHNNGYGGEDATRRNFASNAGWWLMFLRASLYDLSHDDVTSSSLRPSSKP